MRAAQRGAVELMLIGGVVLAVVIGGLMLSAKVMKTQRDAARAEVVKVTAEKESWKSKSEECAKSIVDEKARADKRDADARLKIAAERRRADANRDAMRAAEKRAAEPPPETTCESAVIAVTEEMK